MSSETINQIILQVQSQFKLLLKREKNIGLRTFLITNNVTDLKSLIEKYFLTSTSSDKILSTLKTYFLNNEIELKDISFNSYEEVKLLKKLNIIVLDYCIINLREFDLKDISVRFENCTFNKQFIPTNIKFDKFTSPTYYKCTFNNGVYFGYDREFDNNLFCNCEIRNNIFALKCKFNRKLFCNYADNEYKTIDKLIMDSCTFNDDFILNEIDKDKNSEFIVEKLDFRNSVFNGKVKFYKCDIKKSSFYNTKFKDLADFYGSTFSGLYVDGDKERAKDYEEIFEKTDFEGISVFSKSIFNYKINFRHTKFLDNGMFRETEVNDILDLKDSIIKDTVNFLDIKVDSKKNLANRETARIIKDSFEQQNNIIEANKYYAIEMQKMEDELKKADKVKISEWLIFKIHGLTSNHSQDWFLASLWVILFGMLLTVFKTEITNGVNIFFCLVPFLYKYLKKYMFIAFYSLYFFFMNSILKHPLDDFASNINPFSIMTSADKLTFTELVFKIIIAFLIYQLIVSIRQNTRRK